MESGRHNAYYNHIKQSITLSTGSVPTPNDHPVRNRELEHCLQLVHEDLLGEGTRASQHADTPNSDAQSQSSTGLSPGAHTGVLVIAGPSGSGKTAFAVCLLLFLYST